MELEIDLIELPSEEWREMLAAASVLDLVHGGYFRARSRSILFFCGPESAPADWSAGFPEGSPDLPRALVGQAEVVGPAEPNGVSVRLTVSNWNAVRDVKQAFDRGQFRGNFQDYVLAQESALRGRLEERRWLRAQWERLRTHTSGRLVDDL